MDYTTAKLMINDDAREVFGYNNPHIEPVIGQVISFAVKHRQLGFIDALRDAARTLRTGLATDFGRTFDNEELAQTLESRADYIESLKPC